ncbi:MAG: glycosyltransferase family 4 protein [bacterium]|nr:glycosyltransferase family 4 protein [bacterium]
MKVLVFWTNFGPYHIARLLAAADVFSEHAWELLAVQIADREATRPWEWKSVRGTLRVKTLFRDSVYEEIPSLTRASRMLSFLRQENPDCLVVPGYGAAECRAALAWARGRKRPAILMSDSKKDGEQRSWMKEWLKKRVVRRFDAAVVGGAPQVRYAELLGIPRGKIFVGYDVVDNDFFRTRANLARQNGGTLRKRLGLPPEYFLTVCRFDPVKNLAGLIRAYADYRRKRGSTAWALVLCGSGKVEPEIRRGISKFRLHSVLLPGFVQISDLPTYYGLASCYIAPSLKDTWNLSVNEAMASGLPVLVSRSCGCVEDLVRDGVNGFTFEPRRMDHLSNLMDDVSSGRGDLERMAEASRQIISRWSPETFAQALVMAVKAALGANEECCLLGDRDLLKPMRADDGSQSDGRLAHSCRSSVSGRIESPAGGLTL